jgi:hypothetical protein
VSRFRESDLRAREISAVEPTERSPVDTVFRVEDDGPDMTQPATDETASTASTVLRAVAVLGAVGAVGAVALGGRDALGTFVDLFVPAVVLISLGILAVEYERED